jgi:phosphoglycolate phosphatase
MIEPSFSAMLFDLDGTLTDPFEGIARCLAYALERVDHPLPADADLRAWIGPPLRDSFLALLGDEELAERALLAYRERYLRIGMYENTVYPGIPELLAELRGAGLRLFVATSKIRGPTEGILAHFGLARFFEAVGAPAPADRAHKAEVIASLLPALGADRASAVMVGDTTFDILGARAHELPCIAVGYGYGPPDLLRAAEPLAYASSVPELRKLLLS